MAKSIDCGTSYFISAHENNKVKKQNNAFLHVEGEPKIIKRQLSRMSIPYVELNGRIHIIGKHAFEYAQIFGSNDLRRPMKSGLLNPSERDALPILKVIISDLLGEPSAPNEDCVYCVPAAPIDKETLVDYHEDVLGQIIESLGYKPTAIKEAVGLAYHGLVEDNLSGIAISIGAGMANITVMFAGMDAINFSVARGADWINEHVALDTGMPGAKIQAVRESGEVNLGSTKIVIEGGTAKIQENIPQSNVHQAIKSYYAVLVSYILANIAKQFSDSKKMPSFPNAVPIVIGGGTAMIPGFIDMFTEQLEKIDFPINISGVKLVDSPHEAIALGCLNEAMLLNEE